MRCYFKSMHSFKLCHLRLLVKSQSGSEAASKTPAARRATIIRWFQPTAGRPAGNHRKMNGKSRAVHRYG